MQGGGGSRSTGKSRALDPNVILNSERSERDSGSDQCCELPVTQDRSRNKFGMTLKKIPSLRGENVVNDVAIQATEWHPRLVEHDFLTPNQLAAGLTAGGLPRSRWSLAMTPTESVLQLDPIKNAAFTMAEILLSLTIIGVVAAITLPSLTGNINERTWNTQRKALYARFSQAIALMPALNGYGTLTEDESGSITEDNVAETFVTSGLAKVLKINNICDSEHLSDCGIPSKITTATGSLNLELENMTTLNEYNSMFSSVYGSVELKTPTKATAFETANGESILVYYNPRCVLGDVANLSTASFMLQHKLCANFIYDLNGSKGPNTYGKDIGVISAFYPTDSVVVSPNPVVRTSTAGVSQMSLANAQKSCREDFDNARLPNREELMSMAANAPLFGRENLSAGFHSSNIVNSTTNWHVSYKTGLVYHHANTNAAVWCVNR